MHVDVGAWSGRSHPPGAVVVGYNGKEHSAAAAKYKTRLKELDEVLVALKLKQAGAIQRYEGLLTARLNDLLLVDQKANVIVDFMPDVVSSGLGGQPG